jgi:deoxyribodipyrimidine photo-lyase
MTAIDEIFNDFELGKNYPKPIVDLEKNRKFASDVLWQMQKDETVKKEAYRIIKKHTLSTRTTT